MKTLILSLAIMTSMTSSIHDFKVRSIDGADVELSSYKGKVALIVNVASFCGYTKQYTPLEELYRAYRDRGLVVMGFPANDFGSQEPGTNDEIKTFCSTKYDVTFPMFSKVSVKGGDKAPLFTFLTSGGGNPQLAGEIDWNFEKFLVGKDGRLIARFGSRVDPASREVTSAIEAALHQ
ncbi:MAG: glutathione peroxidase [Candidatus Kapabacteria bacterium]|nr:glutathione peroxidase [Candidatus Kapabacteria bacterium]